MSCLKACGNCMEECVEHPAFLPAAAAVAVLATITLLVVGILGLKGVIPMPLIAAKLMVRIPTTLILGTITFIVGKIFCNV